MNHFYLLKLYFKIKTDVVTRVVIEGEPGSGKTTFIKAVCRTWLEKTKEQIQTIEQDENEELIKTTQQDENDENVGNYSILLAFILRQVTKEDDLIELIKSQFDFLSCPEIYAVLKKIETSPRKVCFMFDGFDELREFRKSQILDVITRKAEEKVIGITTTRSQGISHLTNYNAKAIQARVKLCGFNKEQIKKYISLYFHLKRDEISPVEVQIEEQNMWMLASVPIRLQMMCFVWKTLKKQGRNMAELYKLLLLALLHHMEKREGLQELTPKEDLCNKYEDTILLPTCKLANRWDGHDNLIILFPFSTIKDIAGDNYEKVRDYGCLTKYFPASPMDDTRWNFSHLSLQEYCVAKLIAKDEVPFSEFEKRCVNVQKLEKHLVILEFLCSLAPDKANKILYQVARQVSPELTCVKILKYTLLLTGAYQNLSSVDVPLPNHVVLGGEKEDVDYSTVSIQRALSHLFCKDKEHRNMAMLKVHQINLLPNQARIEYVKGLYITINQTHELERAGILLSQLSEKACIFEIVFADDVKSHSKKKQLLSRIGTKSVTMFSIKGPGVTLLSADMIKQQISLKVLKINDTDTGNDTTEGFQEMCDQANKSEHLKEIHLSGCLEANSLISLKKEVKVVACSRFSDVGSFNKFAEELANSRPNITKLDLSFNKLGSRTNETSIGGKWIAQVMIGIQSLITFSLRCCGITTKTLAEIVQELDKTSNLDISIKKLDLLGNKLTCCADLQGLLHHLKILDTLLFSFSNKSEMPSNLGESKVTNVVAAGTKNQAIVLELSESMCHLDNLCMIYLLPKWPQNVTIATDIYQLQLLFILDVPEELVSSAIVTVSQMLPYMNELEKLYFSRMTPLFLKDVDNILCLIRSLPPSLEHLNMCGYASDQLTLILEKKEKLKNLHKLNIGCAKTETHQIQLIRQELQLLNGNIDVYCDPEEVLTALVHNRIMEREMRDTLNELNEVTE